jgi:hypothetical protein
MTSSADLFELSTFPLLWYFKPIIATYVLQFLRIGRYVVVMPQYIEGSEFTGIHAPVNNQILPSRMICLFEKRRNSVNRRECRGNWLTDRGHVTGKVTGLLNPTVTVYLTSDTSLVNGLILLGS